MSNRQFPYEVLLGDIKLIFKHIMFDTVGYAVIFLLFP